jgi:hypothetical protein
MSEDVLDDTARINPKHVFISQQLWDIVKENIRTNTQFEPRVVGKLAVKKQYSEARNYTVYNKVWLDCKCDIGKHFVLGSGATVTIIKKIGLSKIVVEETISKIQYTIEYKDFFHYFDPTYQSIEFVRNINPPL